MKITFRNYSSDDFMKVRNFLVSTYKELGNGYNWTIERWNFSISLARIMNNVSLQEWEEAIGIWEEDGEIVSIVNAEGEDSGEAYFQLRDKNLPENLLENMFQFAEERLSIEGDGRRYVQLRLPEGDKRLENIAKNRGYKLLDWYEGISVIDVKDGPVVQLPNGFTIKNGLEITDKEKGYAHGKAFGYLNTEHAKRSPIGYEYMRKTPDYRPDLDLYVVSESNEIASFCTIWYDQENQIGILEPVGTNADFRKMGLARSAIGEAISRVAKEGAKKVYVVTGKEFYLRIGFKCVHKLNVWEKVIRKSIINEYPYEGKSLELDLEGSGDSLFVAVFY